jgi:hypothetical protein
MLIIGQKSDIGRIKKKINRILGFKDVCPDLKRGLSRYIDF